MGHKWAMTVNSQSIDAAFLDILRHALNHLYDPDQLRTSPLVHLLALDSQPQAATRLQQLLLAAIQALRPPMGEPAGSVKRRIYQVLQLRYEQQFSQKEVADQLGLSVRQFRRLQQAALETLAFHLVQAYGLADRLADLPAAPAVHTVAVSPDELPESLLWLQSLSATETTRLSQALPEVLRLVQPLADRNQKRLAWQPWAPGEATCSAAIHPQVFRQALLHLLNAAIVHARGSEVSVTVDCRSLDVSITVAAGGAAGQSSDLDFVLGNEQEMVQQMLHAVGADLVLRTSSSGWQAQLCCDRVQEQPVLVVDDHPDTVDLLRRCVEGTRYRIVATHEPQRALAMAQQEQPFVVLLDVMMPGVDGWEVLTRLKQDEVTAHIPVWVCTVLDQSELAISLGADGFLRKPVTREALLQVLDAQAVQEPARH